MNAGRDSGEVPVYQDFYASYWEAQILASVTIRDVAELEFTENPPKGEFLNQLRKHQIRIRDGRKQPAIDWNGD